MDYPWGHPAHGMPGYHEKEGEPLKMRTVVPANDAPFTERYLCPSCSSIKAKMVGASGHWGQYTCECGAEFMVKEDHPAMPWKAKGGNE